MAALACCWCSHALERSPALARRVVRARRHARRMALVVALASLQNRVRAHRARQRRAAVAAAHLGRIVSTRSRRRADSSPRQRVALTVALASLWDRVRVHVRCTPMLQRRVRGGSSAALADPAARSHRADAAASGAVRQRTTPLVLGRPRLLRLFCSDNEGVSKGTNNKNQTRKY